MGSESSNNAYLSRQYLSGLVVLLALSSVFLVANFVMMVSGLSFGGAPQPYYFAALIIPAMGFYGIPCSLYTLFVCPNRRGLLVTPIVVVGAGLSTMLMFALPRYWQGFEAFTALEVLVVSVVTIVAYSLRQKPDTLGDAWLSTSITFLVAIAYLALAVRVPEVYESTIFVANYVLPAWVWVSAWFMTRDRIERKNSEFYMAWFLGLILPIAIGIGLWSWLGW